MLPPRYRYAFEFWHPSWYEPSILDVLRNHDVSLCISDHHPWPLAVPKSRPIEDNGAVRRSRLVNATDQHVFDHRAIAETRWANRYVGYAGGQAEYLRVPFADVGPIKVPQGLSGEQVLFLSDIFPTGYMAADFCNIQSGDTIAIWGCGPVGQLAVRSALLLGAGRVIAIDTIPERMAMAKAVGAETLDFMKEDIYERIQEASGTAVYEAKTGHGRTAPITVRKATRGPEG
jgi:threonine dehydrogenase-like Zn-dependent dehydrogenase